MNRSTYSPKHRSLAALDACRYRSRIYRESCITLACEHNHSMQRACQGCITMASSPLHNPRHKKTGRAMAEGFGYA